MNIFLTAKHWMLFLFMVGPAFLPKFVRLPFPPMAVFAVGWIIFMVAMLGWFYSVAAASNTKLPDSYKKNTNMLKIGLVVPILYGLFISYGMITSNSPLGSDADFKGLVIVLHMLSMYGIFYLMWFAAKQFTTLMLGRQVKFTEYAGRFFLFWFCFIGVWFLQPEINKEFENNV